MRSLSPNKNLPIKKQYMRASGRLIISQHTFPFEKWLLPLIMPFTFDIKPTKIGLWKLPFFSLLSPSNRWAKLRERQPLKP